MPGFEPGTSSLSETRSEPAELHAPSPHLAGLDNQSVVGKVWGKNTPRKEVIQPLLPERLPCYDLVLIADLTLARRFRRVSGAADFAHLTGGVYKT